MFHEEFYPTPEVLINKLLTKEITIFKDAQRVDVKLGNDVLEPSAGKGDIAAYIRNKNRRARIDVIEQNENLVSVLYGKGYNVVWRDFLTFQTHKQYDSIVLNPPFSNCDQHLLKAIEVAEGNITKPCSIYAIINAETIRNPYSNKRKTLLKKLQHYEAVIEFENDAFSAAERTADVDVALIKLHVKPMDDSETLYESIIESMRKDDGTTTNELSAYLQKNGLAERVKEIPRLIKEYQELVRLTKLASEATVRKERLANYVESVNDVNFFFASNPSTLDSDLYRLRGVYWELILNADEFNRRLTSGAKASFLKQLELAKDLEINEENIHMLMSAIIGNRSDILEQSIVDVFEVVTKHSQRGDYNTNIHLYDGWYTNDAFKINHKIVYPINYSGFTSSDYADEYNGLSFEIKNFVNDVNKAFELFGVTEPFKLTANNTFENNVMKFKLFKKGTVHIWFKDLVALDTINVIAGRHFRWLPTEDEVKSDTKAAAYMKKHFGSFELLELKG